MANFGGFGNDDDGFVPTGSPVFAVVSGTAVAIGLGTASYAEPLLILGEAWTNPSSSGFAGGILYIDAGQLKYLGQLGTSTVIAGTPMLVEADGLYLADVVGIRSDRSVMVVDHPLLLDTYEEEGPGFLRDRLLLVDSTTIEKEALRGETAGLLLGDTGDADALGELGAVARVTEIEVARITEAGELRIEE